MVVHLVHRYSPVYHIAGHPMIDHEGTLAFATADLAAVYAKQHDPVLDVDPIEVQGALHWSADEWNAISSGLAGAAHLLRGQFLRGQYDRRAALYEALAAKAAQAAFLEVTRDV